VIRPLRAHHATLEVDDIDGAVHFLTDVLGLVEVERHDIPGARAWAAADRGFQVHLASKRELSEMAIGAAGGSPLARLVPHLAVAIEDVEQAKETLRGRGIEFIDFGRVLFVADPYGNLFELREEDATVTTEGGRGGS
jgi:catechol 2,3-dioxygenase-like lactoylglutathione lyase family enzyme